MIISCSFKPVVFLRRYHLNLQVPALNYEPIHLGNHLQGHFPALQQHHRLSAPPPVFVPYFGIHLDGVILLEDLVDVSLLVSEWQPPDPHCHFLGFIILTGLVLFEAFAHEFASTVALLGIILIPAPLP